MSRLAHFRRRHRDDEGAAAVEFALVVPVLILLVFGIINFGYLFSAQISLNNGVRQAARQAVVAGSTTGQTCGSLVTGTQDASSPALGPNKTTIAVQSVRVSTANPATQTATPCGTAFNTTPAALGGQQNTRVCVGSAASNTGAVESVRVSARLPVRLLVPLPIPGFGNQFTLTSQAVYRCEFTS